MKRRYTIELSCLLLIAALLTACSSVAEEPKPLEAAAGIGAATKPAEIGATTSVVQPTVNLTNTAPSPPSAIAEPTKFVRYVSPTGGDDGNTNLRGFEAVNEGRVVILSPYISRQEDDPDAAVKYRFDSGRIALRVEVRDIEVGDEDGDGIETVIFRIFDDLELGQGNVVYARSDALPPYCMLPDTEVCQEDDEDRCCRPLFFGIQRQWPNNVDIVDGDYRLDIEILPESGVPAKWQWRFSIEGAKVATPTPTPVPTPIPTKSPPYAEHSDTNQSPGELDSDGSPSGGYD